MRLLHEYRRGHGPNCADLRPEVHVGQDVALDLDPGSKLGQLQSRFNQPKDGAFGNVKNFLTGPSSVRRRKRHALHLADEFVNFPGLLHNKAAIRPRQPRALSVEGAAENYFLGVLRDLDKPAGADQVATEM